MLFFFKCEMKMFFVDICRKIIRLFNLIDKYYLIKYVVIIIICKIYLVSDILYVVLVVKSVFWFCKL